MAAAASHANIQQTVGAANPPVLGVQDVSSFVDEIFGTPVSNPNWKLEGFDEETKFVQSLPELLFGANKTNLGTRIVRQRLLDGNFYTQVIAPIQSIQWGESLEIQWDQITFHPHMPQITPEEGRTRIGSWEYTAQHDIVNRFGLGAEFHHEFLYDPRGQVIARGVMDQINDGIETHLKIGVMHAIIHAQDYALGKERERLQQTWKSRQIDSFFARTKRYWGILQREEHAVQLVENWVREEQFTYGGKSNSVMLHWKLAMYVTIVNPKFTEYWRIGDSAKATLDQGIEGFGRWGQNTVYIVRNFDVDRDMGPLDLLQRDVIYGEHYVMFDHIQNNYGSYEGYQTAWRNIQVMDADNGADQRQTIPIMEAARHSGLWDEEGEIISPDDDLLKEYAVDGKGDRRRCTFWYTDATGKLRACRLQGNVLKAYMSPASIMRLAYTAIQSSPSLLRHYRADEIARAIDIVQAGITYMSRQPYDADLQEWLTLVIMRNVDKAAGELHDPNKAGCPPSNPGMRDWKSNQHGSLDLPYVAPGEGYQPEPLGDVAVADVAAAYGSAVGLSRAGNATTYNRFQRVKSRGWILPPLFFSGSGLKTIQDAVRAYSTKQTFEDRFGFNFEECKKLADAVEIVQRLALSLQKVFTGSIFLSPEGVVSSNHKPDAFCAFVDNILAQGRPSVFLRRPGMVYKASAASPQGLVNGGGRDARAIQTADLEQAMKLIVGSSIKAETDLQDRFTGRLSTLRATLQRLGARLGLGAPGAEGAVPPVQGVAARLSGTGNDDVATGLNNSVFSPIQSDSVAPLTGADAAAIHAALPAFAQARLNPALGGRVEYQGSRIYYYREDIALPGAANANAAPPADNELVRAYTGLARLLLNYTRTLEPGAAVSAADAEKFVAAYRSRAVVLSLLTLVNTEPAKKGEDPSLLIARRFNRILDLLATVGVNTNAIRDTVAVGIESLDLRYLKATIEGYFASKPDEARDTFGNARKGVPRDPPLIHALIDQIARSAADDLDAVKRVVADIAQGADVYAAGSAAGVPRFSPEDYMRCDLRFSEMQFQTAYRFTENRTAAGAAQGQRIPLAVPADPEDNDTIVSFAKWRKFSTDMEEGAVVPAALAPTHPVGSRRLGTAAAAQVPAVSNVRLLKRKNVLVATESGAFGIPSSYEVSARSSENYGVNDRRNLVPYDREDRGSSAGSSNRYRMPDAEGMEIDAPSYFRPGARRVSGVAGGLSCLRYTLDEDVEFSRGFQELWDELDDLAQSDPALAAVGKAFLGTPTNRKNFEAFAANNVLFPMTVLLCRPLAQFTTYSLYFIWAGRETMITRFGQPITTWANEAQRQVYSLTLVFKSKTSVINNKNIYHVPNAFIANIKRGFGCQFFTRESFKAACVPDLGHTASFVAIAEPYEPYLTRKPPTTLCLTGAFKFLPFSMVDDPERNEAQHYFNADFASRYWGFRAFARMEKSDERTKMLMGGVENSQFDFVSHAGQSLHWNPRDHAFTYKRASQGYFPDRIYGPGMCTVWRDSSKAYPNQDFSRFIDI